MRKSLMPAVPALSGLTLALWPVQRMIGMSDRILRNSGARFMTCEFGHGPFAYCEIQPGRILGEACFLLNEIDKFFIVILNLARFQQ